MAVKTKNYKRILKQYGDPLIHLCLWHYSNRSKIEFEDFMNKDKTLGKNEKEFILEHFRKEVFPVDKGLIEWMRSIGDKTINWSQFLGVKPCNLLQHL